MASSASERSMGSSESNSDIMTPDEDAPTTISLIGTSKFPPLPNVRSILVTGGAGFIGSWVTRHLVHQYKDDYTIICLDKMDPVASWNNILGLFACPNFHFIHANILDAETVRSALESYQVDCVMHFAASSHVQNSFSESFAFTENNVLGTHRLLDAVRVYGKVKRFVHVSTDEVYGETRGVLASEASTPLAPTNPYAASKAAAEMYVMAYQKSYGLPAIIVRGNNVYGPCQYPEKIIPWFTNLILKNQKLTLQGTGTNARRFLYASDATDAFDCILHNARIGEVYNVDSVYEVQSRDVAAHVLRLFGRDSVSVGDGDGSCKGCDGNGNGCHDGGCNGDGDGDGDGDGLGGFEEHVEWVADRPFNDHDYALDGSKLRGLGWVQGVDFGRGLELTVEWYKRHLGDWWLRLPDGQKEG